MTAAAMPAAQAAIFCERLTLTGSIVAPRIPKGEGECDITRRRIGAHLCNVLTRWNATVRTLTRSPNRPR